MKNEHEQQMEKLRQNQTSKPSENAYLNAPMPELLVCYEANDNIAAFLKRFEKFAKSLKWDTSNYAVYLSALLTGKTLNFIDAHLYKFFTCLDINETCLNHGHLEETCRNKKEFGGFMRTRYISTRRQFDLKPQYKNDTTVKYQSKN